MLYTWQTGDVSKQEPYNGDFEAAMKGIKAKALVLPAKTDLYFRELFCCFDLEMGDAAFADTSCAPAPEDSEIEVQNMRPGIGELKVFPSIWGHWAGGQYTCSQTRYSNQLTVLSRSR